MFLKLDPFPPTGERVEGVYTVQTVTKSQHQTPALFLIDPFFHLKKEADKFS
jgi:hypothetical protein